VSSSATAWTLLTCATASYACRRFEEFQASLAYPCRSCHFGWRPAWSRISSLVRVAYQKGRCSINPTMPDAKGSRSLSHRLSYRSPGVTMHTRRLKGVRPACSSARSIAHTFEPVIFSEWRRAAQPQAGCMFPSLPSATSPRHLLLPPPAAKAGGRSAPPFTPRSTTPVPTFMEC